MPVHCLDRVSQFLSPFIRFQNHLHLIFTVIIAFRKLRRFRVSQVYPGKHIKQGEQHFFHTGWYLRHKQIVHVLNVYHISVYCEIRCPGNFSIPVFFKKFSNGFALDVDNPKGAAA